MRQFQDNEYQKNHTQLPEVPSSWPPWIWGIENDILYFKGKISGISMENWTPTNTCPLPMTLEEIKRISKWSLSEAKNDC